MITHGLWFIVCGLLKTESPLSIGTRGDSRGATQVFAAQPVTQVLTKNPCHDATGIRSQLHSFQVRHIAVVIPLLCNGSSQIRLFAFVVSIRLCPTQPPVRSPAQLGGPFDFCAFARLTPILPGSLKIALKRTRPRQRIWILLVCIL